MNAPLVTTIKDFAKVAVLAQMRTRKCKIKSYLHAIQAEDSDLKTTIDFATKVGRFSAER